VPIHWSREPLDEITHVVPVIQGPPGIFLSVLVYERLQGIDMGEHDIRVDDDPGDGVEEQLIAAVVIRDRQKLLREGQLQARVDPVAAVAFGPVDAEPVDPESIVRIIGDEGEFQPCRVIVEVIVILVVPVIVPVTGGDIQSEGLEESVNPEDRRDGCRDLVLGGMQSGDQLYEAGVVVLRLIGLQVVHTAACCGGILEVLIIRLVRSMVHQVGRISAFVEISSVVCIHPGKPILVELLQVGVQSIVCIVDVNANKGCPALGHSRPLPEVVEKLFPDHRGIVVLPVEVDLLHALVFPPWHIFVKAELEGFLLRIARRVAPQPEPDVLQRVLMNLVVEDEPHQVIVLGKDRVVEDSEGVGRDSNVDGRYPGVVEQGVLGPGREAEREEYNRGEKEMPHGCKGKKTDPLPPFYSLTPRIRHFNSKILVSHLPDPFDTSPPVGIKDQSEDLREEIIVLFALRQFHGSAVGAAGKTVLQAAGAHRAPGGLFVHPAAGAFVVKVRAAGAAIEAAKGDEAFVRRDFFHGLIGFVNRFQWYLKVRIIFRFLELF
jgi:hypothetical protein